MIILYNVQKTYNYPLVRIRGRLQATIGPASGCQLLLVVSQAGHEVACWPIVGLRFAILVHLRKRGFNVFKLAVKSVEEVEETSKSTPLDTLTIRIDYQPLAIFKFVRLVYVTCKRNEKEEDLESLAFEEGRFEAPESEDDSSSSGCRRLAIGALMVQTFFTETLPLKRSCLQLELDTNSLPLVQILQLPITYQELWATDSESIWRLVSKQLLNDARFCDVNCKYLAMCSFSRYSPSKIVEDQHDPSKLVRGYVSLGGGSLALLSSHCLYTWPETVAKIAERLTDDRPVDSERFMNHSFDRNRLWSCFATSLGAAVHELGHTFELGHSFDGEGIMGDGFHHVQEFFTLADEHHSRRRWWSAAELAILRANQWLAPMAQTPKISPLIALKKRDSIQLDRSKSTIKSTHGLRVVEYRSPQTNQVLYSEIFNLPARWYRLHRPPQYIGLSSTSSSCSTCISRASSSSHFFLFTIDTSGNILNELIHLD